jgi:hypothetical protein
LGPMLTGAGVGLFFVGACVAAALASLAIAYMISCLIRKRFHQFVVVLGVGSAFGLLAVAFGLAMRFNVIGGGIMSNLLLGCISWFAVGFAGPAFAASVVCLILEIVNRAATPTRPVQQPRRPAHGTPSCRRQALAVKKGDDSCHS